MEKCINPIYFPGKLWRLVHDQQIRSICWDASGEGIMVYQQHFEAEVLSAKPTHFLEYFRTTDFVSFVRQLNLYGFKKKRRDISDQHPNTSHIKEHPHYFYNPSFKRDQPELLLKIKRLTRHNRAKLTEIKVRKSKSFQPVMLNSPQETSALIKTELLGHQGSPYHHPCNGHSQDNVVLVPVPHHFPVGLPSAHPFSVLHMQQEVMHMQQEVMHMQQEVMPHHTQHRFYTPVNQCCSPDVLDSDVSSFHQPAASYSPCGYYNDYSVGYTPLIDQDTYWNAGDVPVSWTSDMKEKEELDVTLKVAEELQGDEEFWKLLQQSITC